MSKEKKGRKEQTSSQEGGMIRAYHSRMFWNQIHRYHNKPHELKVETKQTPWNQCKWSKLLNITYLNFFLLLLTFIKSNFVELKKYFKSPNSVQWIKFIVKFLLILCFWRSVGSGFYKAGNFVAAINAFTAAIVLDDSIPSYPLTEENRFAIILFPCPKPSVTFLSLAQFKRGAQKTLLRILPRLIFDSN